MYQKFNKKPFLDDYGVNDEMHRTGRFAHDLLIVESNRAMARGLMAVAMMAVAFIVAGVIVIAPYYDGGL